METQIKKVQDYFKTKLLSNDFEITEFTQYLVTVLVDNEYKFTIWIGNTNIPETTKLYDGSYNFMSIPFTGDESKTLSKIIMPRYLKYKQDTLIKQKREELERLENEITN